VIKKKDLTQVDIKTWEEYIKNPEDIFDKDNLNKEDYQRKDRFKFDLHGFSLDDANKKVKELIIFCSENKYKEILLITGKGIHSTNENDIYSSKDLSKLKFSVPEFIKFDPEISGLIFSINQAEIKDGGDGALIIKLKNL
tara:strand:+ start:1235 stop:1654 length:420 start_codon:yes stop_codon:yes gene_type:complete